MGWTFAGPEVGPEWIAVTPSGEIDGVRVFLRWHLNAPCARCWRRAVRTCGGVCAISSSAPVPTRCWLRLAASPQVCLRCRWDPR
jgi:hypothetical protein